MAAGPTIPTDPIELLTPDLSREEPFLNYIWGPLIFGSIAFTSVCVANWTSRRPVFSGIQKHLAISAVASITGKYLDDYRRDYLAERDAVLRHYIQLHPEDFPVAERKKYRDVFEPWVPIR